MFASQTTQTAVTQVTFYPPAQNLMLQGYYNAPCVYQQPQPVWTSTHSPLIHFLPAAGPQPQLGQPVFMPVLTSQRPPLIKREKKLIRIRDPNQDGRDVTEEILFGNPNENLASLPVDQHLSLLPTPSQPSYLSQAIFIPMLTSQRPALTTREKKIIRIRDPNQEGKDVTEEILFGNQNQILDTLVENLSLIPTPPQARPELLLLEFSSPVSPEMEQQFPPVRRDEVEGEGEATNVQPLIYIAEVTTEAESKDKDNQEDGSGIAVATPEKMPTSVVADLVVNKETIGTDFCSKMQQQVLKEEKTEQEEAVVHDAEIKTETKRPDIDSVTDIVLDEKKSFAAEVVVDLSSTPPADMGHQIPVETILEVIENGETSTDDDSTETESDENLPVASLPKIPRKYERDFLLSLMSVRMKKPQGLPHIPEVVLDKPQIPDFLTVMKASVNRDVRLKRTENAWRPAQKHRSKNKDRENQKTVDLFRKMRSILNKLTPEKYQRLLTQVMTLPIDTKERIEGVVDLVFEKAIDEPFFAEIYASLCTSLAKKCVFHTDNGTLSFRKILLNRCQSEFNKLSAEDMDLQTKERELRAAPAREQEHLWEELEEAKVKARRRSVNNMKFVGELFKVDILVKSIIHSCVVKMLDEQSEESLECLCKLLTTVGKQLDTDKPKMDLYFKLMSDVVKAKKMSSRIRFMLQDVIDLRLQNWVPRRADQGPKTIEQVHNQARMEEEAAVRKVQEQLNNSRRLADSSRSGRQMSFLTWRSSSPPSLSASINSQHTNPKRDLDRCGSFKLKLHETSGFEPTLLKLAGKKERSNEERREDTPLLKKPSPEKKEQLFQANEKNQDPLKPNQSGVAVDVPGLCEELMEKRCRSIIEEFLHINDYKEATQCVDELQQSSSVMSVFVRVGVDATLEKNQITRENVGRLFGQLLDAGILTPDQFLKGFVEILEDADDLAVDVPHLWTYLAELVAPVLVDGGIAMKELFREFSKPLIPVRRAGKFFAEILHLLCKHMDQSKVGDLWQETKLIWSHLIPVTEDVEKFIKEQMGQLMELSTFPAKTNPELRLFKD